MLDRRLRALAPLADISPPRSGWFRAVRESLGMSAAQVAARLGVSPPAVIEMERREPAGRVTLETLSRAARAMGCKLVYSVIPESAQSLETLVHSHALQAATMLSQRAAQSMGLEHQAVDQEETEAQIRDLTRELMDKMSPVIWENWSATLSSTTTF
jgi:predicted DNA-binding mobile mystery protein A